MYEARADGADVVGLFVLDDALWRAAGANRLAYLVGSLAALDIACGGRLVVRRGDPRAVVPDVARTVGVPRVHVSASHEPHGRRRDDAVGRALAEVGATLEATGSAYAVSPGRVRTGPASPSQVFLPFRKAWLEHGWRAPANRPREIPWATLPSERLPQPPTVAQLPQPGEAAARRRWHEYLREGLAGYADARDRPDRSGTSQMSVHLRWGEIHPRTMLADLTVAEADGTPTDSVAAFRTELASGSSTPTCSTTARTQAGARCATSCRTTPGRPAVRPTRRSRRGRQAARLSARRRGNASAARHRLDERQGAHGGRVVPRQGPPRALAARRRTLHDTSRGRRRRPEPAQLAVGGGHRARRRTVLPDLQPG